MIQANNVIVILCLLFFINSYAQQQAPVPEWIPGLSEDITHVILLAIVKVANSATECLQTLQNLSYVNKQWHALVQPEESKVCNRLNEKNVQVHERLGIALSEKFSLTPALAVALGVHVVEDQMKKLDLVATTESPRFYYTFSWPHQCLEHAIRKNKKNIMELLCWGEFMDINIMMETDEVWGKIPLLAGAIIYNQDENDLAIIDYLLKSGANCDLRFVVNSPFSPEDEKEYTPLLLAQELNKKKIVTKLEQYNQVKPRYLQEIFD